jgi:ribokinase
MKIFNFGSLNVDHVYSVDEFVQPGQTIACRNYQRFPGGKGCNQSIALAHAGAQVVHVGKIGADGDWIKQCLSESGVDVSCISACEEPTGHAVIQVNRRGENSIIVHGGANQQLEEGEIQRALSRSNAGDFVLTQNETSGVAHLLRAARDRKLFTVFNPAPMSEAVDGYPLEAVDLFVLNETEGASLVGESSIEKILTGMRARFPGAITVLTLGEQGAVCRNMESEIWVRAEPVDAVDTTAAGDTFIGYFVGALMKRLDPETCLRQACSAAGLCVQRRGAADSIPRRAELSF